MGGSAKIPGGQFAPPPPPGITKQRPEQDPSYTTSTDCTHSKTGLPLTKRGTMSSSDDTTEAALKRVHPLRWAVHWFVLSWRSPSIRLSRQSCPPPGEPQQSSSSRGTWTSCTRGLGGLAPSYPPLTTHCTKGQGFTHSYPT